MTDQQKIELADWCLTNLELLQEALEDAHGQAVDDAELFEGYSRGSRAAREARVYQKLMEDLAQVEEFLNDRP